MPLLFLCYVIAYVDRTNVSIATLTMTKDMPAFNSQVIGFGSGIFFVGYFLLGDSGHADRREMERQQVDQPDHDFLGNRGRAYRLGEDPLAVLRLAVSAGTRRGGILSGGDRLFDALVPGTRPRRALSWFLIATPIAQAISPILSGPLIRIGTDEMVNGVMVHHPEYLGLEGWQWVFIAWGIPAVLLGIAVLVYLTDWPHQALWLDPDEREALCAELASEKSHLKSHHGHMTWGEALKHKKVLLLAAAYFFIVTGNYGVEIFLPKILKDWYGTTYTVLMLLLVVPPLGSLVGQRFVGWNSDRTGERRLHASIPIYLARRRCFARWSAPSRCRCFSASSSSPWRRVV